MRMIIVIIRLNYKPLAKIFYGIQTGQVTAEGLRVGYLVTSLHDLLLIL